MIKLFACYFSKNDEKMFDHCCVILFYIDLEEINIYKYLYINCLFHKLDGNKNYLLPKMEGKNFRI